MSLNGLNDATVLHAHEAAAAEPGGWFLLHYVSRDEIQVLKRGNGGLSDMRKAVAEYGDETNPLYGFLKYRRRSVIIKYLPEDCSRIIQARVAVHLNAVCEQFLPFDIIYEITSASDLRGAKLSAACSLHTSSGSSSSSTSSLHRRRLMEIAEEDEEDQRVVQQPAVPATDDSRPQTPDDRPLTPPRRTPSPALASSPEISRFSAAINPEGGQYAGADDRPMSPDSDVYTIGPYPHSKPKVKLGPRPSADVNGQPQPAGSVRPVSAIPAGFKLGKSGKKVKSKSKSKSKGTGSTSSQEELSHMSFPVPPLPPMPVNDGSWDAQDRPTTSTGVPIDSIPLPAPPPQKKPTISPEKARLMKAVKLREKREKKKKASNASLSEEPPAQKEDETGGPDPQQQPELDEKDGRRASLDKDDSGVALDTPTDFAQADQTFDPTLTDSHPTSPVLGSSDADNSTKASSISESTDETTAHAKETMLLAEGEKQSEAAAAAALPNGGDGLAAAASSQDTLTGAEPSSKPAEAAAAADMAVPVEDSERSSLVLPIQTMGSDQSTSITEDGQSATTTAGQAEPAPPADLDPSPAQPSAQPTAQPEPGADAAKKSNVGSSISQRIKALQQRSAVSGDAPAAPTRERPSSTFFAVKKRDPAKLPFAMDKAAQDSAPEGGSRFPPVRTGGSLTGRLSIFESGKSSSPPRNFGLPLGNAGTGRGLESVSVMARIVRDPNQTGQTGLHKPRNPSQYNHLELKQSPLLVNHQSASYAQKDGSASGELAASSSSLSDSASGDESKYAGGGDKKMFGGGRFMRQISNLSGSRSRSDVSASASASAAATKERTQSPAQTAPATAATPTIVAFMGDVNVQFPDNLLWKRRNMCLDSQGYLILSTLQAQSSRPVQGTKKYHLSEFCVPYIPDVDIEELPNSIVLDFMEGSGIQVACEDRAGQVKVLQTLQDAHATSSPDQRLA